MTTTPKDETADVLRGAIQRLTRKADPGFGQSTICDRADIATVLAALSDRAAEQAVATSPVGGFVAMPSPVCGLTPCTIAQPHTHDPADRSRIWITAQTPDRAAEREGRLTCMTQAAFDRLVADKSEAIAEVTTLRIDRAALSLRLEAVEGERDALRNDLTTAIEGEVVGHCEGCAAPLFEGDDSVSDPDGVTGCWHTMTPARSKRERPCYAYRVGKSSAARAALATTGGAK